VKQQSSGLVSLFLRGLAVMLGVRAGEQFLGASVALLWFPKFDTE
jgi:hypothetical protein